jgi:N-acetylglucosamine-6-phosphate deacetylase
MNKRESLMLKVYKLKKRKSNRTMMNPNFPLIKSLPASGGEGRGLSDMRSILMVSLYLLIQLNSYLYGGDPMISRVEGRSYLDGTPVSVEVADGKIISITTIGDGRDLPEVYIAPGLIDNQVNGYIGVGFSSPGLTVEGIRLATLALWQAGVTTYLPTVITGTHEQLMENFAVLARARHEDQVNLSIPGFHLEGPYISPLDGYRGAHNRQWVRRPDWQEFMQFYEAAEHKILQVTIAPELEGAMDFIRKCGDRGILIALGHHNASADTIRQAVDAGARIATHLGNGCANLIHRHLNPLWPQLADDRLMASIIVDGFHLRPEEVQVFFKVKGAENLVLTSDVTKLAGMPPGEYTYDGRTVELTPEGMIRFPAQNVLAGAASPITKGVGNIMRFTHCSLADAIHMASRNPARLYDLEDRGEIKPGKRADLILFTLETGQLIIRKTILAGKTVYSLD